MLIFLSQSDSFKLSKVIEEVAGNFLKKSTYIALLKLKFTLLNLMLWTKNSKIKLSRGILSLDFFLFKQSDKNIS
jgi:hypothetical protein